MPLLKLHLSRSTRVADHSALAEKARKAMVEVLAADPAHGQVVIYQADSQCRAAHPSRRKDFVFAEILMFSGRSPQTKADLFQRLSGLITEHTGVDGNNVFLVIVDSDRHNWAARGGVPLSQVDLGY